MIPLVLGYIALLECTLVTYENLCFDRRATKRRMSGYEGIILRQLEEFHREVSVAVTAREYRSLEYPNVREIFSYIANGDTPEAACQRYFLRVRYGKGE